MTITVKTDISVWQYLSYSWFLFQKGHLHMVSIFCIHTLFPLFKVFLPPHSDPFLFPVLAIALFRYYFLIYSINPIIFSTEPHMWVP